MAVVRKVALFLSAPLACAIAAETYRRSVLLPTSPAQACGPPLRGGRCQSYVFLLSRLTWVLCGLVIGLWFAYTLVKLFDRTKATRREAWVAVPVVVGLVAWLQWMHGDLQGWTLGILRFNEVLFFVAVVVLIRLAMLVASTSQERGRLLLSFGLPLAGAGLGYLLAAAVWHLGPTLGYAFGGQDAPYLLLGGATGLWFAFVVARALNGPSDLGIGRGEVIVVAATIVAATVWFFMYDPPISGQLYSPGAEGGPEVGLLVGVVFCACLARIGLGQVLRTAAPRRPRMGAGSRRRLTWAWLATLCVTGVAGVVAFPAAQAAAGQCVRQPSCNSPDLVLPLRNLHLAAQQADAHYAARHSFFGLPTWLPPGNGDPVGSPSLTRTVGPNAIVITNLWPYSSTSGCFGVLIVRAVLPRPAFEAYAETARPGNFYFESAPPTSNGYCSASRVHPTNVTEGLYPAPW